MTKKTLIFALLWGVYVLFAQENTRNDDSLLTEYIQSKGPGIIVFDASNIKQFWIDKSVLSHNSSFKITLKENEKQKFESVPLRIQLINVNEAQDCKIEIVADTNDIDFDVINNKNKVISSSSMENKFINYNIVSSTFHLEDTLNTTFDLVFNSKNDNVLSVKKMILSFSDNINSTFLSSPGTLKIAHDSIKVSSAQVKEESLYVFSVTGKRSIIRSTNKILTANGHVSSSVTIKNIGDIDTWIYIGYAAYTKDNNQLDGKNYPYKNSNKILNVVSTSEDDKKILVDSYPDWSKNCYLALNAKGDMSDIPNTSLGGRIVEIKQLDNGQAEIILERPLETPLKAGEKVRVHGFSGACLYTSVFLLPPGEEKVFSSSIQKDNSYLEYSSKALSRGVYFVVPLILSYSVDSNVDNTIQIRDFTISY